MVNIFAVELISFSLGFQIMGWFKVVPKAKFIEFCFKHLRTDYVEGLEISICDIILLLSAMEFVEFDGIKGCVQKAFL